MERGSRPALSAQRGGAHGLAGARHAQWAGGAREGPVWECCCQSTWDRRGAKRQPPKFSPGRASASAVSHEDSRKAGNIWRWGAAPDHHRGPGKATSKWAGVLGRVSSQSRAAYPPPSWVSTHDGGRGKGFNIHTGITGPRTLSSERPISRCPGAFALPSPQPRTFSMSHFILFKCHLF